MISAVWLKSSVRTLYYVQYSQKFQLEPYKNFAAFSELAINYYADIVVSKKVGDCQLFVFGDRESNELVLERALLTIESALNQLMEGVVTDDTILPAYMTVATTLNEIVDNGVLLTEEVPRAFVKTEEGGLVSSVLGGVKFLAKTILQ